MAEAEFLTIQQVRELVPGRHGGKLSKDTVFRWINQGDRRGRRLPARKIDGMFWVVRKVDLLKFLELEAPPCPPTDPNPVYEALEKEFGIKRSGPTCSNRGGGDL